MALSDRIEEAAEQLNRYGGGPRYPEFADLLEEIAELNDNIWNLRTPQLCQERADRAAALIVAITERYKRECNGDD